MAADDTHITRLRALATEWRGSDRVEADILDHAADAYDRLQAEHRAMETALRNLLEWSQSEYQSNPHIDAAASAALALVDARRAQTEPMP